MARAVLAILLAAGIAAAAPMPCESKLDAPLATRTEMEALQRTVKSSPFYSESVRRFGNPQSCHVELEGAEVQVTFDFAKNARVTAKLNRELESHEQRLDLPRIGTQSAVALLRAAEMKAYRPRGCGIRWKRGEEERSDIREVVYRGIACNCQGRLVYSGKYVTALILRSAC